jgi:hypothetical protein
VAERDAPSKLDEDDPVSPAELTRRTPEDDGEGAGPGAPETVEPVQGRAGDDESAPGGPAQRGQGRAGPRDGD